VAVRRLLAQPQEEDSRRRARRIDGEAAFRWWSADTEGVAERSHPALEPAATRDEQVSCGRLANAQALLIAAPLAGEKNARVRNIHPKPRC
jgi:hypothetical protein